MTREEEINRLGIKKKYMNEDLDTCVYEIVKDIMANKES